MGCFVDRFIAWFGVLIISLFDFVDSAGFV